jgi:putative ABC transport system substrate-binding protein
VTAGENPTRAAKKATGTIPIITTTAGDPVGLGFATSLARPGGNITGLSTFSAELAGKRLELLKEAIGKLSRVAFISDPRSIAVEMKDAKTAAQVLKIDVIPLTVDTLEGLENAFRSSAKNRTGAFMMGASGFFNTNQKRLIELAAKHRLPGMYLEQEFVLAGGLMTYATSIPDLYRRAATYVDKIVKGIKPGEIPVEQPMKFDFVINLKTAKQIGLEIPQWTLMKADRVIK